MSETAKTPEGKKPLTTKRVRASVAQVSTPKVETFASILKRESGKIKADRALRISAAAHMDHTDLINAKIKEKFSIQNELEAMSDLSTSNHTTTVNRIEGVTFDSAGFVNRRASLRLKLVIVEQELKVLQDDIAFYAL
jgi:hypothetical protein